MIRHPSLFVGLLLAGATSVACLPVRSDPPTKAILPAAPSLPVPVKRPSTAGDFGRLPLSFEPNRGQADAHVRFLTHTGNSTLFLTPSEAIFATAAQPSLRGQRSLLPRQTRGTHQEAKQDAPIALRMQMVGANSKATALEQQSLPGQVNYFIGNDPKKWHTGVPTFGKVGFRGVYPGVDLVSYGNQRHLEYDCRLEDRRATLKLSFLKYSGPFPAFKFVGKGPSLSPLYPVFRRCDRWPGQ